MKKIPVIAALILSCFIAESQTKQTPTVNHEKGSIYLGDLLKDAAFSDQELIEISNLTVVTRGVNDNIKKLVLKTANKNALHFSKDSLIELKPKLVFSNCKFITDARLTMAEQTLRLNGFDFVGGLSISQSEFEFSTFDAIGAFKSFEFFSNKNLDALFLTNSTFRSSMNVWNHIGGLIRISNCIFNGQVVVSANPIDRVELTKNTFHPITLNPCNDFKKDSLYNILTKTSFVVEGQGHYLSLQKNAFMGEPNEDKIDISGNWEGIELVENRINSLITFNGAKVESKFELVDNTIDGKISFNGLVFSDKYNLLRWKQFKDKKLVLFENKSPKIGEVQNRKDLARVMPCLQFLRFGKSGFIFSGDQEWELKDENLFEKHIYVYQTLFNIYRLRGDIESANACYAEMRDVQTSQLRFQYQTSPSFKSYFRLRIQQLLKFYTNHGTDPALAIVISLYVILTFALFYSFYPSEWDLTSKITLLKNFKEFINKNDKGYFKPLVKVVFGFILSFLNAFTLSLNAFTTLGFGEIPTKGLARYVCVLEGFIGWFLLSIFTVALINQVLA